MGTSHLVINLVLAVLAAFAGGVIARRLGQPVILGYLVAGVVISPFTPGPTADTETIQVMAEIGVAFLMFALGAEYSLSELSQEGRVVILGGILQILATITLGPLLAPVLGLTLTQGIYLGALFSLSSTVVALKILMGRGEIQSLHGRVTVGILIIQDLAVLPMAIILPLLSGGGDDVITTLGVTALKVGAVVIAVYAIGIRAVPWLLDHIALARTRELFLLSVVALALGTALATQLAGLSLAFGAFMAGLVISSSEYRTQVIAEALPLRDLFASLFFVSVGMLINPALLVSKVWIFLPLALAVLFAKGVIGIAVTSLLGLPVRVALLVGLSLAQIGEFSFVLAQIGVQRGAIPMEVFEITLVTALITIILTPFLLKSAPLLQSILERMPLIGRYCCEIVDTKESGTDLTEHVVICGYGRVGRELAGQLHRRGLPYIVIDYNPSIVHSLRRRGERVIYGDAANPVVLEQAGLPAARLLAILIPDAFTAETATRVARHMSPTIDIVVRAGGAAHVDLLRRGGATLVVQPEFEAGLEVLRHVLTRYGTTVDDLVQLVDQRREAFYRYAPHQADA